jgi:hypothetical protein
MIVLLVAAAKILAVKAENLFDRPAGLVSMPHHFCLLLTLLLKGIFANCYVLSNLYLLDIYGYKQL